jgi:WD40 repeat protein
MNSDPERKKKIKELCDQALDLDPRERAALLDEACASDDELRSEVESLLSHEESVEGFLAQPAWQSVVREMAKGHEESLAGRRLGRYQIHERIGGGGMGEVWRATDQQLKRDVAIKILPAEFSTQPERVRRFEQEAFAASRLNHPNIITIYEIIHTDGAHFIAEEYVEGRTLREMLTDPQTKQPRKLGVEKALEIAIQIASALKAAHTAWIIHRDIKPENIMVREDGLVKVLDFGIAKLNEEEFVVPPSGGSVRGRSLPPEGGTTNLTIPGAILGTASYMSPEQARGAKLDGRTDLFSLGVTLYEMVTGERLFTGATRAEAIQAAQGEDEPLPPNVRFGPTPNDLQRIIRRMLRRNRDERYAAAGEALDDLSRLKRRLENRTARRIVGLSALAVVVAVALAAVAAFLSVSEVWDEQILRDGHTAAARRAVFSPDGRLLVSVGEDHQVIVWDFTRRERLKTLTDHTGTVNAVAFSPDGKWFVTGSEDQTVIIWDAARLEKATVLREHRGPVSSVTFSTDGRLLASASNEPPSGFTILWDTGHWRKVRELPEGMSYGNYLFLENNRWLANPGGQIRDLSTGQKVRDAHPDWYGNWAAVSPDGALWVNVDGAGNVRFVDLKRRKSLGVQRVHHDHGRSAAFSPDGRWLATAAERVVLWDAATMAQIVPLEYEAIVWSVAFSPDGRWLVSTHGDGAILVWDVARRERVANLREHSGGVRVVAFSPDGRRLATASEDQSVIIWDTERGRKEAVLTGHRTRVTAAAFSPDGRWLASGDQDGVIIRWDVAQRAPQLTIKSPESPASYYLAISPDGHLVASTHGVYESESGRQLALFRTPGHAYSAAFTADGRRLICAMDTGEILLWDARTWQLIERQKWADLALVSLSLSPDGRYLVTGDDEKVVRLGTLDPLRQVVALGRHEARIKSVAFSPDGKQVASAGDDKMIALWDAGRRKLLTRIGTHASPVYAIAFSPDGKQLVSGEHDRSVRLYARHRMLWGFRWD